VTLRFRILLAVCAGIAMTLAAGEYIGDSMAKALRVALSDARDAHLLNTLESNVQSRLSIGLDLNQLETLQPAIELERANAPGILSIDLYSDKGVLLYSTDRSAVGSQVPQFWVDQLKLDGEWRQDGAVERVIGTGVEDDLGIAVGGIALMIDRRNGHETWTNLAGLHKWIPTGGVAMSMFACLLAGVAFTLWVVARIFAPYVRAAKVLNSGGTNQEHALGSSIPEMAQQRRQLWVTLSQDLDAGLTELRALDNEN
jgi:hypothetical protein